MSRLLAKLRDIYELNKCHFEPSLVYTVLPVNILSGCVDELLQLIGNIELQLRRWLSFAHHMRIVQ